jgi:hypothetical protein
VAGVRAALGAAAALALLAAPAQAADDPAGLAEAVADEVVHVDSAARERVSVVEAGRLRRRIVDRAIGRIKVFVVAPAAARRAGGIAALTNGVAQRLELRGALIGVAGNDVWVVTSYPPQRALAAVREAMGGRAGRRLAPALARAVDGVARVDPGPSADAGVPAGAPPTSPPPGDDVAGDFLDDVGDTIRTVFFAVGAAIVLVLLIPLVVWGLRARRRRAEGAEDLALDREAARDELVAIGEILRELDVDVEAPGDPAARDALAKAIDLYDRADRDVAKADIRRRLDRAEISLGKARSAAVIARRRLSGSSGASGPATE